MELELVGAPAMHTATILIEGMTCSACSGAVERCLCNTAGVQSAAVSCVTNIANVEFDSNRVSASQLAENIEDIGFDATVQEDHAVDISAATPASRAAKGAGMWSVELKVKGMTCSACSGTVERHLRPL